MKKIIILILALNILTVHASRVAVTDLNDTTKIFITSEDNNVIPENSLPFGDKSLGSNKIFNPDNSFIIEKRKLDGKDYKYVDIEDINFINALQKILPKWEVVHTLDNDSLLTTLITIIVSHESDKEASPTPRQLILTVLKKINDLETSYSYEVKFNDIKSVVYINKIKL